MTAVSRTKPAKKRGPAKETRRYLVDEKGRRTGVVLTPKEFEELVEAAEQLDDIRYLEEARSLKGKPVSLEELEARLRAKGKLR